MADFPRLNFSTSLDPTSNFPIDARCYFDSLALAKAAAATAEPVGSSNTVYYYGQRLLVATASSVTWYTIQPDGTLLADGAGGGSGESSGYKIGDGLKVEGNTLMVDVATAVEKDNTLPITSGAVYTEVGNINTLLGTI